MNVSELISIEEVEKWVNGDIITIKAGTGKGKSHFIKNELYDFAKKNNKKILMLLHRVNCVNQFQMEIEADGKTDVIEIMTYQKLEAKYKKRGSFDFSQYSYTIADEFHYFMSDASFNKYTDLSLSSILEQTNCIKIFMSATGDYMNHYINKHKGLETIDYELPIDFNFIKHLEFFTQDETLETYISLAIQYNHKAIFFIESAKKAYELHKKFKDHTLFNCSKTNDGGYYKHVDPEKINNMLINERFEELILITTTVMDAGVNIIDDELKRIVVDVSDTGTLIQCIGRKRIVNKDDKINLCVKAKGNQSLGGMIAKGREKMKLGYYLREHGEEALVNDHYRYDEKTPMVYDDLKEGGGIEKKLNELMFFKVVTDVVELEKILKLKEFSYCKYMAKLFGIADYRIHEEDKKNDNLENYLNGIVGKRLMKEDQKELIEKISLKDGRGRLQKGVSLFNAYFKENDMRYFIVSKRTSVIIEGEKNRLAFWEIIKDVVTN